MILQTFSEYIKEGGNVQIETSDGLFGADRIDLGVVRRSVAVGLIGDTLSAINKEFQRSSGIPLWNSDLFLSNKFLSGSSYHFFQVSSINDDDFIKVKSTIGDIDLQCDTNQSEMIKTFLVKSTGKRIGNATLIGFKESAGQLISLWNFQDMGINIQCDFELVEFDRNGFPTAFSQYSHSSAWEDLTLGVKGVFSKFLMQSLAAPKFKKMIIKAKTSRGKDKILTRDTHAFSVSLGLREKMIPVKDTDGNIIYWDGVPEYKELSTKESFGNTDMNFIFQYFFGIEPSAFELKQISSFVGTITLIKKNYERASWIKIVDEFIDKIWGDGAQGLYRGNPQLDLDDKTKAARYITAELGVDFDSYKSIIESYYKKYK